MSDNKILWYKEFKKDVLNENYPPGARNDINAPWNQKDGEIQAKIGNSPKSGLKFKVKSDADEFVILSSDDSLYAMFLDDLESMNNLDSYKEYWEPTEGEVEYADELDAEGIENWAWNEVSKEDIGEGLDDWESTKYLIVKLDEELAQDLYKDFSKIANSGKTSLKRATRLRYLDMMDDIKEKFPDVSSEWTK